MLKVFVNRTNHKLKLFFYLYSYNSLIQTKNNCSSVKFNKSTNSNLNTKFLYNFNSQVNLLTILNMVKSLNSYDSMILDQFCFIFGTNYQNQSSKQAIIEKMILKYSKIIPQSTQKEANQNCETILEAIIKIYKLFDEAKVGFLRGDLHSKTIFKLQKFLRKKYAENKSLKQRDFKNFLHNITSKKNFCLPEKGIYARHLQSKNNLYQRQLVLENVSSIQAIEKFRQVLESLVNLDKIHMTETVKVYIIEWMPNLMKAVRSQHQKCRSKPINKQQSLYGLYLLKINAQRISSLALSQLMVKVMQNIFEKNLNQKKQFEVDIYEKQLRNNIGRLLNYQCIYQRQQKKFKQVQKIYDSQKKQEFKFKNQKIKEKSAKQSVDKQKIGETNSFKKKQNSNNNIEQNELNPSSNKLAYKYIKPKDRTDYLENIKNKIMKYHDKNIPIEIPKEIQKMLGQLLVYLMKQILRIKNKHGFQVPLLTEEYKYSSSKGKISRSIVLKINEDFVKAILPKIEKQGNLFIHQDRSLPTIIQPMPWITPDIGGYYLRATEFMRYSNCVIQEKLIKHADLYRMFNVLNYLNRTPWKINTKILKIVQELWGQGGGISQIPVRYSDLISTQKAKLKKQTNYKKKQQILKKMQLLRDQHSLRSDFILKLAICQSYSKLDQFYLPNNVDFRGRTYPVPPHFNHIGSDLSRGLLLFGIGKQLGSTGLKWLKIHCANLMDQNKSTIKQKQQFINQNLKLIEKIVDNPLKNLQWLDYEDHWQALATMMELIEALKHPNINEFVSYLHIHQDGSCNGLQHYAALGRDIQGAYQVNLGQSNHPGDIYTHVSKAVNKLIQEEVKNSGSQYYQISKKLLNKVKRKTVKQTVMTSVYGVTFIGAREQIYRQLLDQNFLQPKDCYQASIYLAKLTLKAISNLFEGAHRIKSWLLESSKIIVGTNSPVGWITPMGLPVSQPYRRQSQVDIVDTITQTLKVQAGLHKLPFDKSKQKSAFPPNFIHSLDSTHMLYTAQECMKHQLTFTAVHDSYWTHAGDVDKMNQILRDKFIELHQEPILQRLKQSFQMKFPNLKFPQIPQRGQFNLEKVKQSTYFFS